MRRHRRGLAVYGPPRLRHRAPGTQTPSSIISHGQVGAAYALKELFDLDVAHNCLFFSSMRFLGGTFRLFTFSISTHPSYKHYLQNLKLTCAYIRATANLPRSLSRYYYSDYIIAGAAGRCQTRGVVRCSWAAEPSHRIAREQGNSMLFACVRFFVHEQY